MAHRVIASHWFDGRGICCRVLGFGENPDNECGRHLSDILSASSANLGEQGWACGESLVQRELEEIEAERERIWRAHHARDEPTAV